MSLLFSIVSGVAGGIFNAVRKASTEASAQKEQATAAGDARARAALQSANAGGAHGAFAQRYQAQIAKATDSNGDGLISRAELEQQVTKGGGSAESAGTLYKAMDKNGDGQVTADELQSSVPVPSTALAQQIIQMIQAHREAGGASATGGAAANAGSAARTSADTAAIGAAGRASGSVSSTQAALATVTRAPAMDAGQVLARLAAQVQ